MNIKSDIIDIIYRYCLFRKFDFRTLSVSLIMTINYPYIKFQRHRQSMEIYLRKVRSKRQT